MIGFGKLSTPDLSSVVTVTDDYRRKDPTFTRRICIDPPFVFSLYDRGTEFMTLEEATSFPSQPLPNNKPESFHTLCNNRAQKTTGTFTVCLSNERKFLVFFFFTAYEVNKIVYSLQALSFLGQFSVQKSNRHFVPINK